jgi:hypothetical protein
MAPGRAPGLDGLPADFYGHFWKCLGADLWEVLQECSQTVTSILSSGGSFAVTRKRRFGCTQELETSGLVNRLKEFLELIIHRDQSYCVSDRSIMDNIFLMRDLLDVCKLYSIAVGIISLDQEKAFDRVDHGFLFSTLRAFGFGEGFVALLCLLYKEAFCLVKVGGGLSCPVQVQRGIRQGCPISGQLYSLAIEPLLNRLRSRLSGLMLPGWPQRPSLVVLAYADHINVIGKSQALQVGQWADKVMPKLPGNLSWGKQGMKVLGVFLGTDEFQRKNWEGVMERVCARLSEWKWLLPLLSYRGRVLIVNNFLPRAFGTG